MRQMPLMSEIHKIRQSLETDPTDRGLLSPSFEQDPRFLGFSGQVLMTSHAEPHGWNPGGRGTFGKAMAVEAIDLETPRVEFMTETQRLCVGGGQVGASL